MKTRNRFLALALAGSMLLAATGCGNQSNEETKTTGSVETGSVVESTATGTSESEAKDLSWLRSSQNLPIVEEGTEKTITAYVKMSDATVDPENVWLYNFIEEKMNINLEVTPFSSENQKEFLSLAFAGGELPDVIIGAGLSAADLVYYGANEGLLMDMSPYINETYMPNLSKIYAEHPEYKTAVQDSTGAVWSFGFINDATSYELVDKIFYNYEWLDECGLDVPKTLDEFLTAVRAMKEKDPSRYPVGGSMSAGAMRTLEFFLNAFGYVDAGDGFTICLRDGEVVLPCADKEVYGAYLEFMKTLYDEELIHPDYFTMDVDTTKAVMSSGKNGVLAQQVFNYTDAFKDWWGGIPLTSEYNDTAQWPISTKAVNCGGVVVSAEAEDPELIAAFCDWFYTYAGYRQSNAGAYVTQFPENALDKWGGWTFSVEDGTQYPDFNNNPGKWKNAAEYRNKEVLMWGGKVIGSYIWDGSIEGVNHNTYWFPDREIYKTIDNEDTLHDYDVLRLNETLVTNGNMHYFVGLDSTVCQYLTTEVFPGQVYLDADVSTRATELYTAINEYALSETAKFITGARSMDELDDYFAQLEKLGASEYVQIYADYYATSK